MRLGRLTVLLASAFGVAALAAVFYPGPAERKDPPQDRPVQLRLDGPLKVVVLGTSLSARNPWPQILLRQLETELTSPVTLEVIAQPGAGSRWGLAQVGRVAAARPDLVLIEFAINDADLRRGQSLAEAKATHDALLQSLRAELPDAALVLMSMSPASGLRGALRPRLAAYYGQYAELAEAHSAGLIDLYARWLSEPRTARGLEDGLHPTAEATARVVVPAVARYITSAVQADR